VSLDLQKMVWDDPEPKGAALTVLLLLASYVPHERWMRGEAALAWPSQNTIARKCNCRRSTVQLALEELQRLGKIKDTGMRKTRRSVVWELYPSDAPVLTDQKSSHDMTDDESSGSTSTIDLTDPAIDLTDSRPDLTDDESRTGPIFGHKREEEAKSTERDVGEMRARAGARDSVQVGDLTEELAEVEKLLARRPADKLLNGRRAELLAAGGEA
jgi:hypothetical protein